jgi:hypothetical protein
VDTLVTIGVVVAISVVLWLAMRALPRRHTKQRTPPAPHAGPPSPQFVIISRGRPNPGQPTIRTLIPVNADGFQATREKNDAALCFRTGMEVGSCTCEKHLASR